MNDSSMFGAFIREKHMGLDPHISLRKMAELLKLSQVHMSNIRRDVKWPQNMKYW